MISRRSFIAGGIGAGFGAGSTFRLLASPIEPFRLTAMSAKASFGTGHLADVWAYNQSVPGSIITVKKGDELAVLLENRLEQPTSLHWHGIRLENAMDGVPGLTQAAVQPGEDFLYRFKVPDAGTYWYHSHFNSPEQVGRGLAGLLIVEENDPYPVDRELHLVVDDWRLDEDGQIAGDFSAMHDISHGGRMGNYITFNGQFNPDVPVEHGERVRVRILNAANSRIIPLGFENHDVTVVALDGQPVVPFSVANGRLTLAPGQRVDAVIDMFADPGGRYPVNFFHRNGVATVAHLSYNTTLNIKEAPGDVPKLSANPLNKKIDLDNAVVASLNMEGGAMGGMRQASYDGKNMGIRELVDQGKVWAFNGVVGLPDQPLLKARAGQTMVMEIANNNSWPHAMHLHGHHFTVVERNGEMVANHPWHDTLLINRSEKVRIAFVADNPGKWLFHCHMLEHQMGGMITWLEVV